MKPNREAARNIRVLSQTSANQDLNRQSINNHPNYNNNSMNMMSNNANSLFNNSSFAHTSGDASTSLNTRPNNSSSVNKSNAGPPIHGNNNVLMNHTNGFSAAGADNTNKTQTSLSPFSNKNTRTLKDNANYQPSISNNNPIQLINNSGGIAYPVSQSQQQQSQSMLQEQMKKIKEDLQRREKIKKMQQDKLIGSAVGQSQGQNVIIKQSQQQSQQQQQRNSHQHIQQLIIQQQQQQLQQQPPQQEPKQDFRREIERRFQRSNVNKTFVFPRKNGGGNQNTISGGDSIHSSNDSSLDSIKNVTIYDLRSQNNKPNNPRRVQRSTTDHSLGGTKPLTSDSPEIKNNNNNSSNIVNQANTSISQFNKNSIKQQQLINSSSQQVKTEGDDHSQNINSSTTVVRTHSSISKPMSQYTQQQQQQQALLTRENQQFASLNQKLLGNGIVGQQLQKNDSSLQQPFSQTNGFLSNSNTKSIKRGEIAKSANKSYDHKIQNASTTFTTIQSKSSNSRRPQQSQGFENTREQDTISNPRYATEMSPEKKSNISDFLNSGSIQNNSSSINYDSQANNRQHSKSQSGNKLNTGTQYNKNQVSLSKNGRQTQNNMRIFQLKNDQLQKIYKCNIKRPEYPQNNLSSDLSNYSAMRVQTEGSEPANKNSFYNKTQQDIYKKFKVSQQPNQMTQNLFAQQQQQIFNQNNMSLKKQKLPIL